MPEDLNRFDPLLLSEARLGIISVLISRPRETFPNLKALLGLTQGNLGLHLQKLEEAGYIAVTKHFAKRRPCTTCALTNRGRRAFLEHVARLRSLADGLEDQGWSQK